MVLTFNLPLRLPQLALKFIGKQQNRYILRILMIWALNENKLINPNYDDNTVFQH